MKSFLALLIVGIFIFLYRDGFCFSQMTYNENQVIENTLKSMITEKIDEDKKSRTIYWLSQGKSKDEIKKKLNLLEVQYEREKEKILKYCKNNTKYCEVNNKLNKFYYEGRKIELHINYFFDNASKVFFNQIPFVTEVYLDKNKLYKVEFAGIISSGFVDVCSENSAIAHGGSISLGDIDNSVFITKNEKYLNSTTSENGVFIGTVQSTLDKNIYVYFTEVSERKKIKNGERNGTKNIK